MATQVELIIFPSPMSGYQSLLNHIVHPAWLMDSAGYLQLTNPAWREFIEIDPANEVAILQPHLFWNWIDETHRPLVRARWELERSPQRKWTQTLQLSSSSGTTQFFNISIEPLDAHAEDRPLWLGTALPMTATTTDPSSIYRALEDKKSSPSLKEVKLRRQLEFVRRVLESNQDCIKVLDGEGRLLYMNSGGQQLMEIEDFDSQAYGVPWLDFWEGSDRVAAQEAFATACAGGVGKFDGFCATAKGLPKWWEVIVAPISSQESGFDEILSVSRDITARKLAEQALQERNQELDRFVYIVSHDLKAPLRGVANLAEWLAEDLGSNLAPENLHQLRLMQQRVQRMNGLIEGLLKYSRVGREELRFEPVDMAVLVEEVLDSLSPPPGFEIQLSPNLPTLQTKRLLLFQVMSNLVGNAIKHHDQGEGRIQIQVDCRGSHYQFAIADDGPGIPPGFQDQVFEIFRTLENHQSAENTGIGLALVKKIVTSEGGRIWLESQTPRGCRFCFTWPALEGIALTP